jgi:hypothetical protein
MMNFRKNSPQALRFADRRKREDEAPRLSEEIPDLASLQLDIEDRAGVAEGSGHRRRIVVEHAPALFLLPCGDPRCTDGGHDLTSVIMRPLRSHELVFHGEDACTGTVGTSPCARVVKFDAVASYRPERVLGHAPVST